MHRTLRSITIAAVLFGAAAAQAQTQSKGLHNTTKQFTAASEMALSDLSDPQEIKRTWDAALVRVPTGQGSSKWSNFDELQAQYGDGSRTFPTAIYMHGCSGIWPGTLRRIEFLANSGFLVIAPASMARQKYARSCNTATSEGGLYRDVLRMRQFDAGYAIENAKTLSFVDAGNMALIGLSEGGIVAATFEPRSERQKVAARVIEGWTCNAGWYEYDGVNAPEDEPVLSLVGEQDPWFQDIWTKGDCTDALHPSNGSLSVGYRSGKLASRHELMENPRVQEQTLSFLRQHVDLP